MTALPEPSELTANQALLTVDEYDLENDRFRCTVVSLQRPAGAKTTIFAELLPKMIDEHGEPDELVGRTFLIGH